MSTLALDARRRPFYCIPNYGVQKSRMTNAPRERSGSPREQKEAALASLFDEYYDRIARYANLRLGDWSEAEDLAGEAFLKALEALDSYRERGIPMQAWLFKIAHNLMVDRLRRRDRQRSIPLDSTTDIAAPGDLEAEVGNRLQWQPVAQALHRLTAAQQQVIGLRFFAGLTSQEVAEILGKKSGAVRELQSAALRALRQMLHREA